MGTWELACELYISSYPVTADVSRIQPLSERRLWEKQLWLRVANKALERMQQ